MVDLLESPLVSQIHFSSLKNSISELRKNESNLFCVVILSQQCQSDPDIWFRMLRKYVKGKVGEFSVMGDFGFAREHFEWDQLSTKHNIGPVSVGTHEPSIDKFGSFYQVSNTTKAKELVTREAYALKKAVVKARSAVLLQKKQGVGNLERGLIGGQMAPETALNLGLIDGLLTCQEMIRRNRLEVRQEEQSWNWLWRLLNPYGNILNIFRRD